MDALLEIARQFNQGVTGLVSLGNGLINDTFLTQTSGEAFVLQKINRQVFPQPELIMLNLSQLNRHIAGLDVGAEDFCLPALIPTKGGGLFFQDAHDDYWRAWTYIDNSDCLERFRDLSDAKEVGAALGRFHRLCFHLDKGLFHDTLPGFHIAPGYFAQYLKVKSRAAVAGDEECERFIDAHRGMVDDLEAAKAGGLLGERIIHGDPKLNNFLFDKTSKKVVSLIDLDTVKPGLIHYDIGDCLRSCCHVAYTNTFDLELCAALLSSYTEAMRGLLTTQDFEMLYPAIRLIPFELGLRFYTDHLDGNRYFKVSEPGQNLRRARAQFQLCSNIISNEKAIKQIVAGKA